MMALKADKAANEWLVIVNLAIDGELARHDLEGLWFALAYKALAGPAFADVTRQKTDGAPG